MSESQHPRIDSNPTDDTPSELVAVLLDAIEQPVGTSDLFSPVPEEHAPSQRPAKQHMGATGAGSELKTIALTWVAIFAALIAVTWLLAAIVE